MSYTGGPRNLNGPDHGDGARRATIVTFASKKMFEPVDEKVKNFLKRSEIAAKQIERRQMTIRKNNFFKSEEELQQLFKLSDPRGDTASWFTFSQTPPDKSSSRFLESRIVNNHAATLILDRSAGCPRPIPEAILQYICDYANTWHTALKGNDGRDPLFYSFPVEFLERIRIWRANILSLGIKDTPIKPTQFWKLRYLFVPIVHTPDPRNFPNKQHMAICVISPEAKTIDYLCSIGDNGMPPGSVISTTYDGSNGLPDVIWWLNSFLNVTQASDNFLNFPNSIVESSTDCRPFIPEEWKLRTGHSILQREGSSDCSFYAMTNAMCLAFGWGIGIRTEVTPEGFPTDHQFAMKYRRHRIVQDLWFRGYHEWRNQASVPLIHPFAGDKKIPHVEGLNSTVSPQKATPNRRRRVKRSKTHSNVTKTTKPGQVKEAKVPISQKKIARPEQVKSTIGTQKIDEVNRQYYPLIDEAPTVPMTFHPLLSKPYEKIFKGLPPEITRRSVLYADARTVKQLMAHCTRNERFYPGWYALWFIGDRPIGTFLKFRNWIEEMDEIRLRGFPVDRLPAPYKSGEKANEPMFWISPLV